MGMVMSYYDFIKTTENGVYFLTYSDPCYGYSDDLSRGGSAVTRQFATSEGREYAILAIQYEYTIKEYISKCQSLERQVARVSTLSGAWANLKSALFVEWKRVRDGSFKNHA